MYDVIVSPVNTLFFDSDIMLKFAEIGELFRDYTDVFTPPILLQE